MCRPPCTRMSLYARFLSLLPVIVAFSTRIHSCEMASSACPPATSTLIRWSRRLPAAVSRRLAGNRPRALCIRPTEKQRWGGSVSHSFRKVSMYAHQRVTVYNAQQLLYGRFGTRVYALTSRHRATGIDSRHPDSRPLHMHVLLPAVSLIQRQPELVASPHSRLYAAPRSTSARPSTTPLAHRQPTHRMPWGRPIIPSSTSRCPTLVRTTACRIAHPSGAARSLDFVGQPLWTDCAADRVLLGVVLGLGLLGPSPVRDLIWLWDAATRAKYTLARCPDPES